MKNIKNNISVYLWLLTIILLSIFIIYRQNDLHACFGLVDGIISLSLNLLLLVLLIVFVVVQFLTGIRKKERLPFIRLLMCLLGVFIAGFTLLEYGNRKENKLQNAILVASANEEENDVTKIILLNHHIYYAIYGNVDWTCSFTGKYKKVGDTLLLDNKPFEISNNRIYNQYIMTETSLIPVLEQGLIQYKELKISKRD